MKTKLKSRTIFLKYFVLFSLIQSYTQLQSVNAGTNYYLKKKVADTYFSPLTAAYEYNNIKIGKLAITIEDTIKMDIINGEYQIIEACSVIEGLPSYSETPVDITGQEADFGLSVFDDCNYTVTYQDEVTGSCPWVVKRTFTAVDDCGNSATARQIFTIDDTTPPVITPPEGQTIEACSVIFGVPSYSETPVDITGQEATFGFAVNEDCNFTISYQDQTAGSCPWTVTRTFTATDDCGNSTTVKQVFIIDDRTEPVITPGPDHEIEACSVIEGLPSYSETTVEVTGQEASFGFAVNEDCNFTISYQDQTAISCPWVVTRTFTATDDCGNSATAQQLFMIDDISHPLITSPADQTIQACSLTEGLPSYSETPVDVTGQEAIFGFSVYEDCNYTVTYQDEVTGNCPWVVKRTFTVNDDCGNYATARQIFTIDDTTCPVITTDSDQVVEACSVIIGLPSYSETPVDITGQEAEFGFAVNEDCNFTISYQDQTAGSCPWVVTRTFTASDDCGNSATTRQIFTIDDTTEPIITPGPDKEIEACSVIEGLPSYSETTVEVTGQEAIFGFTVNEDCNFTITYQDEVTGNCPWFVTRTFSATDHCGNTGGAMQLFTINDTLSPVFTTIMEYNIEAFPNPFTDNINLSLNKMLPGEVNYSLFNINGSLVLTGVLEGLSTEISLRSFTPGVYLLKVNQGTTTIKTFKIIKNNQ